MVDIEFNSKLLIDFNDLLFDFKNFMINDLKDIDKQVKTLESKEKLIELINFSNDTVQSLDLFIQPVLDYEKKNMDILSKNMHGLIIWLTKFMIYAENILYNHNKALYEGRFKLVKNHYNIFFQIHLK